MMLLILLLAGQDAQPLATVLADYRAKTSAEVRCRAAEDPDEVVVCAGRDEYRHRLPLVPVFDRRNNAHDQEARIETPEAQGFVECGKGAFLVRCGSVGIGVTIGLGGGGEVRRASPP
jgi:hypothetical protein